MEEYITYEVMMKPIVDKRGHIWRKIRGHIWRKIKPPSDINYAFHCSYCGLYVYADRKSIQNGSVLATFKNTDKYGFQGASFLSEYGTCDEIIVRKIMSS